MEMPRLAEPAGDGVHVNVERARCGGLEPHFAANLLTRFPHRSRGERAGVRCLGMPTRLQPSSQTRVVDEADALTRRIADHRTTGEMGSELEARERILKRLGKLLHLNQVLSLPRVLWLERVQETEELFSFALQSGPSYHHLGPVG